MRIYTTENWASQKYFTGSPAGILTQTPNGFQNQCNMVTGNAQSIYIEDGHQLGLQRGHAFWVQKPKPSKGVMRVFEEGEVRIINAKRSFLHEGSIIQQNNATPFYFEDISFDYFSYDSEGPRVYPTAMPRDFLEACREAILESPVTFKRNEQPLFKIHFHPTAGLYLTPLKEGKNVTLFPDVGHYEGQLVPGKACKEIVFLRPHHVIQVGDEKPFVCEDLETLELPQEIFNEGIAIARFGIPEELRNLLIHGIKICPNRWVQKKTSLGILRGLFDVLSGQFLLSFEVLKKNIRTGEDQYEEQPLLAIPSNTSEKAQTGLMVSFDPRQKAILQFGEHIPCLYQYENIQEYVGDLLKEVENKKQAPAIPINSHARFLEALRLLGIQEEEIQDKKALDEIYMDKLLELKKSDLFDKKILFDKITTAYNLICDRQGHRNRVTFKNFF